jgi:hypothetical protein
MDALSRVVFMGESNAMIALAPDEYEKLPLEEKEHYTECSECGIVPISSIPGPRGCKLTRSEREKRVPLRHALSHYSDPEEGTMNTSSVTSQNLADAQW